MISPKLRLIREYNRTYSFLLKAFWHFRGNDAARIYMFHSVLDKPEQVYSKFAITKDSFERFLKYELSRGQVPMDLNDFKASVDNPKEYNNRFAVTFDDIYDSVYTNAYTVLKRLNIPFVIFVTPGLIDKADPASKNPFITSEHLSELMSDELCIVGSHGIEHSPFRNYSYNEALESLKESKTIFGRETELFAFPYGRRVEVSNANIHTAQKAGYFCAFSALDGTLREKWLSGQWFLPRILVGEDYVNKHVR